MISDNARMRLERLVLYLEDRPSLTPRQVFQIDTAKRASLLDNLPAAELCAKQESARAKALDVVFKGPDPQAYIKAIENDLGAQVRIVTDLVDEWFTL